MSSNITGDDDFEHYEKFNNEITSTSVTEDLPEFLAEDTYEYDSHMQHDEEPDERDDYFEELQQGHSNEDAMKEPFRAFDSLPQPSVTEHTPPKTADAFVSRCESVHMDTGKGCWMSNVDPRDVLLSSNLPGTSLEKMENTEGTNPAVCAESPQPDCAIVPFSGEFTSSNFETSDEELFDESDNDDDDNSNSNSNSVTSTSDDNTCNSANDSDISNRHSSLKKNNWVTELPSDRDFVAQGNSQQLDIMEEGNTVRDFRTVIAQLKEKFKAVGSAGDDANLDTDAHGIMEEETGDDSYENSLAQMTAASLATNEEFDRNDKYAAEMHMGVESFNVGMNVLSEAGCAKDECSDESQEKIAYIEHLSTEKSVIGQSIGMSDTDMMAIIDRLSKDEGDKNVDMSSYSASDDVMEILKSPAHNGENVKVKNSSPDVSDDENGSDKSRSSSDSNSQSGSDDENMYVCTDSDVSGDEEVIGTWQPSAIYSETQNGTGNSEERQYNIEDEMISKDVLSGYQYNYGDIDGQDDEYKEENKLNMLKVDVKELIEEMDTLARKDMEDDIGTHLSNNNNSDTTLVKPITYNGDSVAFDFHISAMKTQKVCGDNVQSHVKFHTPTNTIFYDPESPVIERVCVELPDELNDFDDENEDSFNDEQAQANLVKVVTLEEEAIDISENLEAKVVEDLKQVYQDLEAKGEIGICSEKIENIEQIQKHGSHFNEKVESDKELMEKHDIEQDKKIHVASIYDDIIGIRLKKPYSYDEIKMDDINLELFTQRDSLDDKFSMKCDGKAIINEEKYRNEVANKLYFEDMHSDETQVGMKEINEVENVLELKKNYVAAVSSSGKEEIVNELKILEEISSKFEVGKDKLNVCTVEELENNKVKIISDIEQSLVGDVFCEKMHSELENKLYQSEMKNIEEIKKDAANFTTTEKILEKKTGVWKEEPSDEIKYIDPEMCVASESAINILGVECSLNLQKVPCEAGDKAGNYVNLMLSETDTLLNELSIWDKNDIEPQSSHQNELNLNYQSVCSALPSRHDVFDISDAIEKDSKMIPATMTIEVQNTIEKREAKNTVSAASKLVQMVLTEVLDLIYWQDVKKTTVVFSSMMFLLLSLTFFTILSVVAYLSIGILTVTLTFRVYKNVMQAVQKSDNGHPFRKLLELDMELREDFVESAGEKIAENINCCLRELRRLFLVEDYLDSLKFGLLLWLLTYIGCWFDGMTMVTLAVVAAFTLPKVYDTYKGPIDQNVNLVHEQFNKVMAQITAKIPYLKTKPKAQ